jgi:murein DD-endopeptidase MepM/ murein hydrolase activator NlpD
MLRPLLLSLALALLGGCMPSPTFTPTPTRTPAGPGVVITIFPTPTPPIATTLPPTAAPETANPPPGDLTPTPTAATPDPAASATDTAPPPSPDASLPADHFVLIRPIPEGWVDYADRTYAYGSTAGNKYRPHTGVEFFNPASTPVVAAGNATVEHAGNDWEVMFGPEHAFYGNLIVLRLTDATAEGGQPVFCLYGHLSEVLVETGQSVPVGEIIGAVGGTGVANGGPHLHFEVRVGDPFNYFASTRNPDLWIKPYFGYGALAGRVMDAAGNLLREVALTVRGADAVRYTWSYAGDENVPDAAWGENFTLGDLPEGWYTVTTRSNQRGYSAEIYVEAGRTSWLEFKFD